MNKKKYEIYKRIRNELREKIENLDGIEAEGSVSKFIDYVNYINNCNEFKIEVNKALKREEELLKEFEKNTFIGYKIPNHLSSLVNEKRLYFYIILINKIKKEIENTSGNENRKEGVFIGFIMQNFDVNFNNGMYRMYNDIIYPLTSYFNKKLETYIEEYEENKDKKNRFKESFIYPLTASILSGVIVGVIIVYIGTMINEGKIKKLEERVQLLEKKILK